MTTSSEYQADEALVRAALDGLRDEPFEVVATMPAGIQGLGTCPRTPASSTSSPTATSWTRPSSR